MSTGVHLLKLADRNVGVDLRGVQPRVAQHFLDIPDVGSSFQHVGRHRVTPMSLKT